MYQICGQGRQMSMSPQYCPHGSGEVKSPKTFQANSAT